MADPRRRRRKPVKQIQGAHIGEYSAVDQPATARDFVMFKGMATKADFPGIGSDEPGSMPTGGTAPGLTDLQACLARHPDWDPAQCEAAAAGEGLDQALEADMEGDDATVSDPPTAGDFRINKDVQLKPEEVDVCVAGLLADPEFDAADFPDRESRAFATCQAQTASTEEPTMPRKQEPLGAEEISIEGEPMPEPTVEISTTAVEWPMEQCIVDAKTNLGTDDDGAVAVCSMIRTEFGNMENPDEILLPEGMTTDQALQSAALTAGIAKTSDGEVAAEELDPQKRIKFTGKNRWWRSLKSRIVRPKTPDQKALASLHKEVLELKQDKSKDREIGTLLAIIRNQARQLGHDPSDYEGLASVYGLASATPAAPVAEPESPIATADELLAEAKRRKDELEGVTATAEEAPAKPIAEMTPEELVAEIERLQAILAPAAVEGEEPVMTEFPVVAGSPAAMGAPDSASGAPPEGMVLVPMEATRCASGCGKTAVPAQRKSAAPASRPGTRNLRKSTILSGSMIPAEDRKACGWTRGV